MDGRKNGNWDGWMQGRKEKKKSAWIDGRKNGSLHGWMEGLEKEQESAWAYGDKIYGNMRNGKDRWEKE